MASITHRFRHLFVLAGTTLVACGGSVDSNTSSTHAGGSGGAKGGTTGGTGAGGFDGGLGGSSGSEPKGGTSGIGASGGQAGTAGAKQCSSTTCGDGCCAPDGTCLPGTKSVACGTSGNACMDCQAAGFTSCDPDAKACITKQTDCNPQNCQQGCCAKIGGASNGSYCFDGLSPSACGIGGQICSDCTKATGVCDPVAHACGAGWCNETNCGAGCCLGSQCVSGTDLLACGTGGAACTNCSQKAMTCQTTFGVPGGKCDAPLCNSASCSGCCSGDICAIGTQANACGEGGVACVDCGSSGKSCQAGQCQ